MGSEAVGRTEASTLTERLREEIVAGKVPPGSKLKLVPLARRFAVSRGPLREAVSRLAAEGLVHFEDQRGFWVAPISREDLLDLTQTRQRIEQLCLRDALAHGDLAWEGRVSAAAHVLDRVTEHDGSPEAQARFVEQHELFHSELVSACPSAYLLDFRARLFAMTERYRNLAAVRYRRQRASRDVAAEHRGIAEAVLARDVERACALLNDHLQETANTLISAYPELFGESA